MERQPNGDMRDARCEDAEAGSSGKTTQASRDPTNPQSLPSSPLESAPRSLSSAGPLASRRIDHADVPIVASPSGLPTQHLISAQNGATRLFIAQQWLQPGERVLLHTHPVEEAITFLSGSGEATLGDKTVPIGGGVSLYIPAGEPHGFTCIAVPLHVMIAFPVARFAETTIVDTEGTSPTSPVPDVHRRGHKG